MCDHKIIKAYEGNKILIYCSKTGGTFSNILWLIGFEESNKCVCCGEYIGEMK